MTNPCPGDRAVKFLTSVFNRIRKSEKMPAEQKFPSADLQEQGRHAELHQLRYRGITLMSSGSQA